jgi:hypothetical protein
MGKKLTNLVILSLGANFNLPRTKLTPCGLFVYIIKKTDLSKKSLYGRKIAQSGHPAPRDEF